MPSHQWDDSETKAVLDVVKSFGEKYLRPKTLHPEMVITPEDLKKIIHQAYEIGILGDPDDQESPGLWRYTSEPGGVALSVRSLEVLGCFNPGIAFTLHQLALGDYLCHQAGITCSERVIPLLHGSHGLGRTALARYLAEVPLTAEEELLLKDLSGDLSMHPVLIQSGATWNYLLCPQLNSAVESITWSLEALDTLTVDPQPRQHGLDETAVWKISKKTPGNSPDTESNTASTRSLLTEGLAFNALAMMSIALGSVRYAYEKALDYSMQRIQGGHPVYQHPAVNLMLGNIQATIVSVEAMLRFNDSQPASIKDLARIFGIRAVAHPLLCQAATDALQVFGGNGYMQDYGMEKILRDNQHLKLLFGTPGDLKLFIAAVQGVPCV
ncbi:MAG: hypothetical protein HQM11_08080 [SAR324 cluster bacterium]|nr:hypothetical protein [SAR324 cluster bacterium]